MRPGTSFFSFGAMMFVLVAYDCQWPVAPTELSDPSQRAPQSCTGISISVDNPYVNGTLMVGDSLSLLVYRMYDVGAGYDSQCSPGGQPVVGRLTWSSDHSLVAEVESDGTVRALRPGTTTIHVLWDDAYAYPPAETDSLPLTVVARGEWGQSRIRDSDPVS